MSTVKATGQMKAVLGPPLPAPSGFMNYPGDSAKQIVGELKGPNYMGEWMTAVSREYDPSANRTRVGFAIGVHGPVAALRLAELDGGSR